MNGFQIGSKRLKVQHKRRGQTTDDPDDRVDEGGGVGGYADGGDYYSHPDYIGHQDGRYARLTYLGKFPQRPLSLAKRNDHLGLRLMIFSAGFASGPNPIPLSQHYDSSRAVLSSRALVLTQPYIPKCTVLGGASGLCLYTG